MSFLRSFGPARPLIGVDLAGRWMKAFQFLPGRAATLCIPRRHTNKPFGDDDASLLAAVIERSGFQGTRLVVVPPRDAVMAEVLELPPRASGAPIDKLARMEFARSRKCDPASFEIGVWELPAPGRAGDQCHVFAAGLPLHRSEPILDALERAGLEPVAIDVPALALARAHAEVPNAMLEMGWDGALVCVGHQGVVVYERMVEEGSLRRLLEGVSARLKIPLEAAEGLVLGPAMTAESPLASELRAPVSDFLDALARELQRSIAYVAHRYQATSLRRMTISGDGAGIAGLAGRLHESLGMQIDVGCGRDTIPAPLVAAAGAARHSLDAKIRRAA
jgi:Tfp pilus assembly PilM family ATPase